MSCYAVTRDNRLLKWDQPAAKTIWLREKGDKHELFYRTCACQSCADPSHEQLITYIYKSQIVSVGFERPAAIEGRLLTWAEKQALQTVADWIATRRVPAKIKSLAGRLKTILAMCERG